MALLQRLFGGKKPKAPKPQAAKQPATPAAPETKKGSRPPPSAQQGIVPSREPLALPDRIWLQAFLPEYESGKLPVTLKPGNSIQLLKVVDDPAVTSDRLADEIQSDPALAAEVLKLANSAAYGRTATPLDLGQAINRVGTRQLRMILMTALLKEKVRRTALVADASNLAWRHSMFCAVLASNLARPANLVPEAAYMAALFHNVGVLALLATIDTWQQQRGGEPPSPRAIVEVLKGHAYEATPKVMADWNFPDDVAQAARRYRTWKGSGNPLPLAALVALSNDICARYGLWTEKRKVDLVSHPTLYLLKFGPEAIPNKAALYKVAAGLENL